MKALKLTGSTGTIKARQHYWVRLVYGNDGWDVICDYTVHLESVIGRGTEVDKLIEHASEYGVVPDCS